MTHPVEIIHIVHREVFGPVLRSQVLKPLTLLDESYRKRIVLFQPARRFLNRDSRREMRQLETHTREFSEIEITHLPSLFSASKFGYRDGWLLGKWLDRRKNATKTTILHCRNALAAVHAIDARKSRPQLKVIFDCRGAMPAEVLYRSGLNESSSQDWPRDLAQKVANCREAEARAMKEADHVSTVSNQMVQYLRSRHGAERGSSSVVPCCVDITAFRAARLERFAVRQSLDIENRFVVGYCGSLEAYQLPEQSLRVFRCIQRNMPQAFFFAVTSHPDRMREAVTKAGISPKDFHVLSSPPEGVPRLLSAADVGLLLRDESVVNQVAAPLKFAEYLAAGLPVVLTPQVGDYTEFVRKNGCGTVVKLEDRDDSISEQLSIWCKAAAAARDSLGLKCFALAEEHFSWDQFRLSLVETYQKLLA